MLIVVTIVFITSFYFFFKNSRAGSPLNDKEYMEQLSAASKRYNTAGTDVSTMNPEVSEPIKNLEEPSFIDKLLQWVTSILQ